MKESQITKEDFEMIEKSFGILESEMFSISNLTKNHFSKNKKDFSPKKKENIIINENSFCDLTAKKAYFEKEEIFDNKKTNRKNKRFINLITERSVPLPENNLIEKKNVTEYKKILNLKKKNKFYFFKNNNNIKIKNFFKKRQNEIKKKKKTEIIINSSSSENSYKVVIQQKYNKSQKKYHYSKEKFPTQKKIYPLKNKGMNSSVNFNIKNATKFFYLNESHYRKYQFEMLQNCLIKNSLIILPTGLGKTFIALNVIYNFYKWYPKGKIFFLAPSKPLVSQQYECILKITKFDKNDICELTGNILKKERINFYKNKKIFFMTPQTLENDLIKKSFDPTEIVLIIFDEAHRATGNYSYKKINLFLEKKLIGFRICALSATPGNDFEKTKEIIRNLSISNLEIKEENDSDVWRYIQRKKIFPLVISNDSKLNFITKLINKCIWIILKELKNFLKGDCEILLAPKNITGISFNKVKAFYDSFKRNCKFYNKILSSLEVSNCYKGFKMVTQLIQCRKHLLDQGFIIFKDSIDNFIEKTKLLKEKICQDFLKTIEFNDFLIILNEYTLRKREEHPKSKALFKIITQFFADESTFFSKSKIIIFTHNRKSAQMINNLFKKNKKIRSEIFIGQNNSKNSKIGLTQNEQKEILKKFRNNELNILVATCVAEEGLDIGEVDLIVCYDSGLSPIRLTQRMGRTGRKRNGKVILLLNPGEYQYYIKSKRNYKKLIMELKYSIGMESKAFGIRNFIEDDFLKKKKTLGFYKYNPRMFPEFVKELNLVSENFDFFEKKEDYINFFKVEELIDKIVEDQEVGNKKGNLKKKKKENLKL